jgi:hypothetical protein
VTQRDYGTVAERYRPMLCLLDERDPVLVAARIYGFGFYRRVRRERRLMFRIYLRDLVAERAELLKQVRQYLVDSPVDRPEMAKALLKSDVIFAIARVRIQVILALHALWFSRVEVSGMIGALRELEQRRDDLAFVQAVAGAG